VKRIGASKTIAELIAARVQVALAEGRLPFPEPPRPAPPPSLLSFRQAAEQWLATYPALACFMHERTHAEGRATEKGAQERVRG
jgi:hypothetical protein